MTDFGPGDLQGLRELGSSAGLPLDHAAGSLTREDRLCPAGPSR